MRVGWWVGGAGGIEGDGGGGGGWRVLMGDRGRGVRIVRTMVDGDVCLAALVLEIYLMPQGYECRT